jgi:plastocyanin
LVAAKRRALKFTYSRELYHSCARSRLGNSISTGKIGRHSPSTTFVPLNIEVNVGESVPWINPTEVAEPYSVTFLKDKTKTYVLEMSWKNNICIYICILVTT